jgi:hypothetical protein
LISQEELDRALADQVKTGTRLGEILVKQQLISSPELTEALMEQLGREVAKEGGFGTGLWSKMPRRNAQPTPAGAPLSDGETGEAGTSPQAGDNVVMMMRPEESEVSAAELEREFIELRAELIPDASPSSPTQIRPDASAATVPEASDRDIEIDWLEQDLDATSEELDAQESRLEVLKEALADRERRIAELEETVTEMSATRDASEARSAEAKLDAAAAEERHLALQADLSQQLADANTRLTAIESEASVLRHQLEESERAAADGVQAKETISEIQRGLEAALSERDEALAKLEHEIVAAAEELELLREELDRARQTVSNAEKRARNHEREAIKAADELAAERLRAERESAEHERHRAAVEESIAESKQRVLDLTRQLESTKKALANEQTAHESSRHEKSDALERLQEMAAQLDEARVRQAHDGAGPIESLSDDETISTPSWTSREQKVAALSLAAVRAQLAREAAKHAETRRMLARVLDELAGLQPEPDPVLNLHGSSREECFLCLASTDSGYLLEAQTGFLPEVGDTVQLRGAEHVVMKIGASPLPSDARRCVYLQATCL